MIKKIAYVLQYKNFRVIDEEKNIVIAAICDASKKSIVKLYVNGEENYFDSGLAVLCFAWILLSVKYQNVTVHKFK